MKLLAVAALFLSVTSFNPAVAQQRQPEDVCLVEIVNLLDGPITFRVAIQHGEFEKAFEDPVSPGQALTFRVPCGSKDPLLVGLQNIAVPSDFISKEVQIPPPGMTSVWCLGSKCDAYREAQTKAKIKTKTKIT